MAAAAGTKTVLITGASTGIGLATAVLFQEKGWNVVATMRTPEKDETLKKLGDQVLVTRLDVTDRASIDAAVAEALAKFGQIDVLINNAGYGAYGPLEAFPVSNIRRQFDVNVIGLLETTQAVLPSMRAKKEGVIVNISSMGGRITFPLGTLYHGTKFAVEGISEALHWELEAINVKVKVVEPGAIKTDFGGRSFDFQNDADKLPEYQPTIAALMKGFAKVGANAIAATACAEVIFTAATDGTDEMRYRVGPDCEAVLAARDKMSDADLFAFQKSMLAAAAGGDDAKPDGA